MTPTRQDPLIYFLGTSSVKNSMKRSLVRAPAAAIAASSVSRRARILNKIVSEMLNPPLHSVILRHPPPSGRELWLTSPDLDAFSLFHQSPDTALVDGGVFGVSVV
jgi:hypothetical protein